MTYGQKLTQEAKIEGKVEGKIEGLEKGIEKGIFQVAKSMLKEGLAMHLIQKVTGLSQEEVGRLQATGL
jgi:predicted transposase/invertase (TIGR01784 family)